MNHTPATIDKKVKPGAIRSTLVTGVLLGALGLSAQPASASFDATTMLHFKGRAASTVLTDCLLTDPVGTHCRAVNVIAYEERVNDNGELFGGPGLNVLLFDVTLIAEEPFFVAEQVGFGRADTANVDINGFAGATASAVNVPLCEEFECAPGDQDSISVDVVWSGFGPVERFVQHDKSSDGLCWENIHATGSVRVATSAGIVDGVHWHQTNVPDLAPTLQSDGFGAVQRCTLV